jgi:hypothetical protein
VEGRLAWLLLYRPEVPADPLAVSDLEDHIDSLLRSHGQNDLRQMAADLARKNV